MPFIPSGMDKVPAGHLRLYHQTRNSLMGSIMRKGLLADQEGTPGLWATTKKPYYPGSHLTTIEFHAPASSVTDHVGRHARLRKGEQSAEDFSNGNHVVVLNRNVSPAQFLQVVRDGVSSR